MKTPPPLAKAPLISDWVRFAPDRRLQVFSGRVELGQGNMTALAQIAADELDVDPACVAITGADTTRTPDEGFTSGSMSIVQGGMAIRFAASAARAVLLAEAAKLLQQDVETLSIEAGTVRRDGPDADLDLWDLAAGADLDVPVLDHARPKPPEARRIAGASLPRIDIAERVTGHPFVHDLAPDGLLHGRPVHPPALSARLVALDLDGLKARPGVVAVVRDGSFVGVVAETEHAAILAARWAANRAEWALDGDAPADPVAAIGASDEPAETVHEAGADPGSVAGTVYETAVTRQYLSHGSIGPSAALAEWSGDRLTIWSHTQGPYPLKEAIAMALDLDAGAIDVIHHPGSGCYGHNGADDVALDAALMARAVPGRPVLVVWSRADEFRSSPLGPGMQTRVRAVVGEDRRIAAMDVVANSAPHGNRPGRNGSPNLRAAAYLEHPKPPARSRDVPLANGGGTDRNAVPGYAIPNLRIAKRVVHAVPYRTSSMRALGGHLNVYALETLMDDIAAEIGEDPVAFRLAHLDDARARAVVEAAVAETGGAFGSEAGEGAGWGLGYARYKNTAAYCAIATRVEVEEDVRVTDVFAAIDPGEAINPDGIINQTEGGIIQAASWTLKEALRFDGLAVATETWLDYPILTFSEVPRITVRVIPRPEEPPLGCAEAAQGPMAAALGNAVFQALGARVRDLPLTRDAIVTALSS
ncbi:xanthine dehydrogenase family protein molybdopterin-binding subunit [Amorphus coralli]|uniref:xanthine dehydrogenase family protein molybdopterin-binding subunit n=1 Tax=Amorphus coralli TaxID=340680 RepID=UPI00036FD193|nr:molybdopterin cofactor-binding domain-containing protein [Amorphus coralli]